MHTTLGDVLLAGLANHPQSWTNCRRGRHQS